MSPWTVAELQTALDAEPALAAVGLLVLAAVVAVGLLFTERTAGETPTVPTGESTDAPTADAPIADAPIADAPTADAPTADTRTAGASTADGDSRAPPAPGLTPDGGDVDRREIEMVVAYVRPEKLDDVKGALAEVGAPSLTVTNVSGRGSQPAKTGQWRGEEYTVDLHRKVKLECVVADTPTGAVVDAIADAAYTGRKGDGKVFVLPVSGARQIRTGKTGPEAV